MLLKKRLLVIIFLLFGACFSQAQYTAYFQGGEGTAADNWSYVTITNNSATFPPGPGAFGASLVRTGTKSIRLGGAQPTNCTTGTNCLTGTIGGDGCNPTLMNGKTLEFTPVNISCLQNVQLKAYTSSHLATCSGAGFDDGDYLYFEVQLNGGAWQTLDTLNGQNNNTWTFGMTSIGGLNLAPNPFVYNVPAGTTTFAFRIRGVMNRSDEFYYVDDVSLTTTSTGFGSTAGLWTGRSSTDWTNPCNWYNLSVPTSTVVATIPDTSVRYCEILPGTAAQCAGLNLNDTLKIENSTSSLTINGSFLLQPNGFLDMSLNPTTGGVLSLTGNWRNNRDDSFFDERGSKVIWNGTTGQTIIVDQGTKEVFSAFEINKPSLRLISNEDIWIDPNNERGNMSVFNLINGVLDLKTYKKEIRIGNYFSGAISRTNGGVCLEDTLNRTRFVRAIDPSQGPYIFPLCNYTTSALTASQYIPVTLSNISGSLSDVSISTYQTFTTNLPWPSTPVSVNNLNSTTGLLPDNRDATADRFWNIISTNSLSGNITFAYNPIELPISPYNDPLQLKAQRYNDNVEKWESFLPGQSAGNYFVTVPSVSFNNTWTLASTPSPLPVELLTFQAVPTNNGKVKLYWSTASETNSWYYTVERSANGTDFYPLMNVEAAGNINSMSEYHQSDNQPLAGTSYYRLRQVDYDGQETLSEIVKVNFEKSSAGFSIFPNPSSGIFYLLSDISGEQNFVITDPEGRTIKYVPAFGELTTIDLKGLSSGMYFVRSSSGSAQRIIIR